MKLLRSTAFFIVLFLTSYVGSFAAFTNVDCTSPADRLVLGGGSVEIGQVDCEFLEQIYDTTNPTGWTDSTGWDTVSDVNSWFGVARNAGGVSQLVMANNNMTGDVSGLDFAGITQLSLFIISSNSLSGDLSSWDITNLSNISDFEIQYNTFTGDLGSSGWDISGLATLQDFYVNNNSFTGDLSGWDFSGLPLINEFFLRNNSFTGDLSSWDISGLSNLGNFQIQSNSFTGDLSSWDISGLSNLVNFVIASNGFTGDIGSWVLPIGAMTNFNISINGFTGDIGSWILPPTLRDMRILSNDLTGDLSSWILPSGLTSFLLRNNSLTGDISSWVIPPAIVNFQIYNNNFLGDISSWVLTDAATPNLRFFQIHLNPLLTGDLSSWNTLPASLDSLLLYRNDFFGDLSSWVIPNYANAFNLSHNNFTGDLGSWVIGNDSSGLDLRDNAFAGDVPDLSAASGLATGSTSFDHNQFETADATKDANADAAAGNDWSTRQTIAPENPAQSSQTATDVIVSIDTYEYASDGDFNLSYSTTMGGPYTSGPVTAARSAGTDITVPGLTVDTLYYGVIEASTPANVGGNILTATSTEFIMLLQSSPDVATASDLGASDTDNITSDTTPDIEGSCIAGSTVTLYVGGIATTDTTVCTAGGTYSITPTTAFAEGVNNIQVTQTIGGNESTLSSVLAVTIDTVDPIVSASVDTAAGIDTPTINFSAIEAGSGIDRIEVEYIADNSAAGVAGTTTIDTLAGTATSLVLALDPDELTHEVKVRYYDNAGNVSEVIMRFPPLIDITAPTIISNTTIDDTTFTVTSPAGNDLQNIASTLGTVDCNSSGNGTGPFTSPVSCTLTGITGGGTATITAEDAVTAATGQNSQAYIVDTTAPAITITDDILAGPVQSDDFSASIVDTYGDPTTYEYGFSTDATCDATDTYGNAIVSGTPVTFNTEANNGSYLCVIATDLAGNTTYSPASSNPLNIDVTPPTFVITAPVAASSTNDNTPTVTGTGEIGATIVVTGPLGETCTTTVDASGNWSCDISPALADGSNQLDVVATDAAGNASPASSVTITIDTIVPAAPTIANPTNGLITNDNTPVINGTGEPGATFTITDASNTVIGTGTVDPSGNYTFTPTTALPEGSNTLNVTTTDAAGNTSLAATTTFTIDVTAPTPLIITAPVAGSSTNDNTPTVTGTGEAGATIVVTGPLGETCTTSVDANGDWSCDISPALADGSNQLDVVATDPVGNTSPVSSVTVTVDTSLPFITITNTTAPNVIGTGEPGASVTTVASTGQTCTTIVDTNGDWVCTLPGFDSNGVTVISTITDLAGNEAIANDTIIGFVSTGGGGSSSSSSSSSSIVEVEETVEEVIVEDVDTVEEIVGVEETIEEVIVEDVDTIEETTDTTETLSFVPTSKTRELDSGIMVEYTLENTYDSCPIIDDLNNEDYSYQTGIFPDVAGTTYEELISKFYAVGVVDGTVEGNFEPTRAITRTEFTKMVLISHCYEYKNEDTSDLVFTDVDTSVWQAKVIKKASTLGIINGDTNEAGESVFRPNDVITKAEATKILMRMAFIRVNNPIELGYSDIQTSWHAKYTVIGESLGVFNSKQDSGLFYPNDGVLREDMVSMIYRVVDLYR